MKLITIVDSNRGIVFVNPEFVQTVSACGTGSTIVMRENIVMAKDPPDDVAAKLQGFGSN